MTISKEINCAEHEYMNIGPPNYRSSGAPAFLSLKLASTFADALKRNNENY